MSDEETTVQANPGTDTEVLDFESMSKNEMADHLKNFHGLHWMAYGDVYNGGSTKEELAKLHEILHEAEGFSTFEDVHQFVRRYHRLKAMQSPRALAVRIMEARERGILVKHVHAAPITATSPTEDERKELEALGLDKPLTASQKKALKDLLDNDFAILRTNILTMGAELKSKRVVEHNEQYAEKKSRVPEVTAVLNEFIDDYKAARRSFEQTWGEKQDAIEKPYKDGGFTISADRKSGSVTVDVSGEKEAMRQIEKDVQEEIATAKLALENQRLKSQRQIMLAGLPKESLKMVDNIPSAEALMRNAAQERTAAQKAIQESRVDG